MDVVGNHQACATCCVTELWICRCLLQVPLLDHLLCKFGWRATAIGFVNDAPVSCFAFTFCVWTALIYQTSWWLFATPTTNGVTALIYQTSGCLFATSTTNGDKPLNSVPLVVLLVRRGDDGIIPPLGWLSLLVATESCRPRPLF